MRALTKVVAVIAVASLCVAGLSTASSATTHKVGSAKWCKHHPNSKLRACTKRTGGGGGGGGTGGPPPPTISVTVSPNGGADPLIETGMSEVHAVVEVETSASFAGDMVNIDSSQLAATCGGAILFGSLQPGAVYGPDAVEVFLDDDGNATVSLAGFDCAPGPSLIEADLTVAPFLSVLSTIDALPPAPTTAGVVGSPANEVETGNSPSSGNSDVYAVFVVETDPVYAGQSVEIESTQLADRCFGGVTWLGGGNSFNGATAVGTFDNDGNAVFSFTGAGCAAGPSTVIADVLAGVHSTYLTTYTIVAPAPTI